MGQSVSSSAHPPWIPGPGLRYPKEVEDKIVNLSQSETVFLSPPEEVVHQVFVLEDYYEVIEAALQHDDRLLKQLENLVPSKVSEDDFWKNYFSHVSNLRRSAEAIDVPNAEPKIPSTTIKSLSPPTTLVQINNASEKDIDAALVSYVKTAVTLPPFVLPTKPINWGIIGSPSSEILKALSIKQICNIKASLGPLPGYKVRQHASATDVAVDEAVNGVYVGSCQSDEECIERCKLVLRAGKICFVQSCRPLFLAYDLFKCSPISAIPPLCSQISCNAFGPRWSLCLQMIENGHLGTIGTVQYRLSLSRQATTELTGNSVSPFECTGSVTLYILDLLFGTLQGVHGIATRTVQDDKPLASPFETATAFVFRTESNAVGSAVFNFASKHAEDKLTITGTKGCMTIAVFANEPPAIVIDSKIAAIPNIESLTSSSPSNEECLIRTFIAESGSGIKRSVVDRQRRVGKLVDIILREFYGDRHDYYWTRSETWGR
uniref:BSD domain-containing protein n=1 Tax=Spongospora subterranea TaxID=70186 RepID=A0A0H5RMU8_9EUKA|eukprot:CRZ10059.1 hypothetical protein [Spongospora subterranea]